MKFEFDHGYPTDDTLLQVKLYHGPVLDFFRSLKDGWWNGETGVREIEGRDCLGRRVVRFRLHTWGWSGNESLIGAMQRNVLLWVFTWVESRVGGHYIFEFRRDMKIPEKTSPDSPDGNG